MDDIETYFGMLFGDYNWSDDDMLEIRLLGEKDTKSSEFRHSITIQPSLQGQDVAFFIGSKKEEWEKGNIGVFVCPAPLSGQRANDSSVKSFSTALLDIDAGNTAARLSWLEGLFGVPTMVVASGGKTEDGSDKLHVYYKFTEQNETPVQVAALREAMAALCGADASFKRIPQVVRVPGTAHTKGGRAGRCRILKYTPTSLYDFAELANIAREAQPMPGVGRKTQSDSVRTPTGGMNFSGVVEKPSTGKALTSDVAEGGAVVNRWSQFSLVAGHHIYTARRGDITIEEAYQRAAGWVMAHMQPAWDSDRIEREFNSLLAHDQTKYGDLAAASAATSQVIVPSQTTISDVDPEAGIHETGEPYLYKFAPHRMYAGDPPPRRFLIEGLILAAKAQLLVAEAGAGKTYLELHLALIMACGEGLWLGQRATNHAGKHVVVLIAEDDRDEIHFRLEEIDPGGVLRAKAGNRLIIIAMPDSGGTFPLVEKDRGGNPLPSGRWLQLWQELVVLSETPQGFGALIIDTFSATMHGEENAAVCVNEWFRVANDVHTLGAALIVTHHVAKAGRGGISTPSDMLDAIRGSTALPANVRAAIGVWHDPGYEATMRAMGREPKPGWAYKFAVIKANNPEMLDGVHTIVRAENCGLLIPAPEADQKRARAFSEREAWLLFAIAEAARANWPFLETGGALSRGLFANASDMLPGCLHDLTKGQMEKLVKGLIQEGKVVKVTTEDGAKKCLDVTLNLKDSVGVSVKPMGYFLGARENFDLFRASGKGKKSRGETEFFYDNSLRKVVSV